MKNLKNHCISINDIPSNILIFRLLNDKFIVIDGNDLALDTVGILKEELVGKDALDLFQGVVAAELLSTLHEAYNSLKAVEFNLPAYVCDNLCCRYKGSVKKLFNGDLLFYYQKIVNDKEFDFEELQNQIEIISEAPYVGIAIFDTKFLYANKVLENILGYSFEELKTMNPMDLVCSDNKEEYISNLQKRLSGTTFTTTYLDVSLLKKNKKEISVRLCIKTVKYKGKYRALASVIDITNLIEQEQKTKRLAQALEQTDDLLSMTDINGKMIYVNKKLVEKMGYTKEELIGKKASVFKSGKHNQRFYKRLWNTILSGNKYTNLIINKTKAGKLIYLETTITPVFDKDKKLESFVSTSKDVTYQIKTKKRLKNLAMTDRLTKVLNRYAIDKELEYYISVAKRHGTPFSLLMLDLDYFKNINDAYGHYIGDIVLKSTAKLLNRNIRKVDKLGRWGGEEFIIILYATSQNQAKEKAEVLRELIENNKIDKKYNITASIGVTTYQEDDTKSTLFFRVDKALYRAKEKGRNCVSVS